MAFLCSLLTSLPCEYKVFDIVNRIQGTRKKKYTYINAHSPILPVKNLMYRIFCKRTKKEQKLRDKSKERHLTYNLNSKAFLRKTQVRLGAQYCELWD